MKPRIKALFCSCIVYFATVQWGDFGNRLWYKVLLDPQPAGIGSTFALWKWAGYLVWTLLLQLLLYLVLASLFRRETRWLAVPTALLMLFVVIGFPLGIVAVCLDARVVPFLYREREGPPVDWQESCRILHAHLLVPSESRYTSLESAGRAWFFSHVTKAPRILSSEKCQTLTFAGDEGRAELSAAFVPQPDTVSDEGRFSYREEWFGKNRISYIYKTWSPEYVAQMTPTEILYLRPGADCGVYDYQSQTLRNVPRKEYEACPVLSSDSDVVAILAGTASSKKERRVAISSTRLNSSVDISQTGPGLVALLDVSAARETLLLLRQIAHRSDEGPDPKSREGSYEHVEVGFNGKVLRRLPRAGEPRDGRLLIDSSNWVWWPDFTPSWLPCCDIEWNIAGKAGNHHVARGRVVVSVSLCPGGRLVAASVTDMHKTGHVPDSVYVFRTSDGKEVFRRQLPAFSKSRVQFLGASLLAYTDFDGTDGFVRVVRVPESAHR